VREVENQCLNNLYAICASAVSVHFIRTKG